MTKIHAGQAPALLTRALFRECFNGRFYDPAFETERDDIARLEAIARDAFHDGRKAPITRASGHGFAAIPTTSCQCNCWTPASD